MDWQCSASPRRRRPAASIRSVRLYHARDCHLCERARAVLQTSGVEFDEVDITGDAELEARYREWLPVVEFGGERAFVYYVDADALRRKLGGTSRRT
jgi:glutaredoxin